MPSPSSLETALRRAPALICAGFVLWVVVAWTGYDRKYAQATQGWRPDGKHLVELKLAAQDRDSGACASDANVDALRCAFQSDRKRAQAAERDRLSPYKAVNGMTLLGAGLWQAPALAQPPRGRFTVVCNFHLLGVIEPVALRWQKKGKFESAHRALPAGRLGDCVIPQ